MLVTGVFCLFSLQQAAAGPMSGVGHSQLGASIQSFMSHPAMPVSVQKDFDHYLAGRMNFPQLRNTMMMPDIPATSDRGATDSIQGVVQAAQTGRLTQEQAEKLLDIVKTVLAAPFFSSLPNADRRALIQHGQTVAKGASAIFPEERGAQMLAKVERMIQALGVPVDDGMGTAVVTVSRNEQRRALARKEYADELARIAAEKQALQAENRSLDEDDRQLNDSRMRRLERKEDLARRDLDSAERLSDELERQEDDHRMAAQERRLVASKGRGGRASASGRGAYHSAASDFMVANDMMRPFWEREEALSRMHPRDAEFWAKNSFALPFWVRERFSRDRE